MQIPAPIVAVFVAAGIFVFAWAIKQILDLRIKVAVLQQRLKNK